MALVKAPFFLVKCHSSRIIAVSNPFIFQVHALMFPRGDDGYSKKRQSQFLSETLRSCLHVLNTGKGALPAIEIMEALIHHFKTVQAVKEASLEELQKVVNNRMADLIHRHFNQ